ncbi:hypothetical protein [Jannaschia rubra]|uniref:hypothetical protein n=1 Tax=Jannaschia rubra TaxID=282197 RepID=UPI0006E37C0E|nr:hypothetical protein [Jannaschia rubra]
MAWYAAIFAMAVLLARRVMAVEWSSRGDGAPVSGLDAVLRDGPARRLLLIVLVDATPVAVTATLFLVHMADHLRAPGGAGPAAFAHFAVGRHRRAVSGPRRTGRRRSGCSRSSMLGCRRA